MSASYRTWIKIFGAAYSSWASSIGTILATVALCNLAFRILNVSMFEALAWILLAYRKTFYPPIDYLLSFISLRLPSIAKDVIVIYLAIGGVLYRTVSSSGVRSATMGGCRRRVRICRRMSRQAS
jgi:hypothetical protein